MRIEHTNIDLNFGQFDAVLDTSGVDAHTNAQLTITLKVFLRKNGGAPVAGSTISRQSMGGTRVRPFGRRQMSDMEGHRFEFANFAPDRWDAFTSFYQREGQRFWTGNFWLSMHDSYDASAWGETLGSRPESRGHSATLTPYTVIHPAVDCHFALRLVNDHSHKTIDVYNIVRNLTPVRGNSGATFPFRADDSHYDQSAIGSATHLGNIGADELMCVPGFTSQRTFLHEIGHALGLEHVGVNMRIEGCFDTDDHNITICYGNTLRTRENIMGAGESLSWHEALPWRRAMEVLTGTTRHSWQVHQSYVGPQSVLRTS